MCPPIKTITASTTPITGIMSLHILVRMFTVIAIPPVARQSAKRRAYDKTSPIKPNTSIRPYAPLAHTSNPREAIIKTAPKAIPIMPTAGIMNPITSKIIPASNRNQLTEEPRASFLLPYLKLLIAPKRKPMFT